MASRRFREGPISLLTERRRTSASRGANGHQIGWRSKFGVALLAVTVLAISPVPPTAARAVGETADGAIVVAMTETATVFREADGTNRAEIYSEPVNYRRHDGTWVPIDTTVDPVTLRTLASPLPIEFAPLPVAGRLATIASESGTLSFGPVAASPLAFANVSENRAIYAEAYPGVDLVYEARSYGLKEEIVLKERPRAPVAFKFVIESGDLISQLQENGAIYFTDAEGNVVFVIPRALMSDSAFNSNSGEPAASDQVVYSLASAGSRHELTVTPDFDWLRDPARVYPVTIDPTFTDNTPGDAHVQKAYPNSNYASSNELKAGTYDGGGDIARSFLRFDISDARGTHVLTATLSLYEHWAWSCNARAVDVRRIQEDWSSSTVTWNNRPSIGSGDWDTLNVAKGYEPGGCADARIEFDGLDDLVQRWADNVYANDGLAVVADNETDNYGWKKFNSVNGANNPKLTVTYNRFPTITGLTPAAGTINTSATRTTPTLSAVYNDPDSGDVGHVDYQVCSNSTCTVVEASGSGPNVSPGTTSPWTVPAGELTSGTEYWWRARSDDGVDVSAWTSTRSYVPDLVPSLPTDLSPASQILTSVTPQLWATYIDPDAGDRGYLTFEVYDTENRLVASGQGSTVLPGQPSRWTVPSGLTSGTSYYWRAKANDGFLESGFVSHETVTVDLAGDVYHAMLYEGDPAAGGALIAEEWARVNTFTARSEDEETIVTRSPTTCTYPASACERVNGVLKPLAGDPTPKYGFWSYESFAGNPDLDQVATLLAPATNERLAPQAQGPISDALASWQTPPAGHGPQYEFAVHNDTVAGVRTERWIDGRTKLPLKMIQYLISDSSLVGSTYWTYVGGRTTIDALPANHFDVQRPSDVGFEDKGTIIGDVALGPVTDQATGASFRAFDIGASAEIDTGSEVLDLCLSHVSVVRQILTDPQVQNPVTDPDPDFPGDPAGPDTYVVANYAEIDDVTNCDPGTGQGAGDLQIISMASASALGEATEISYLEPAQEIEADPTIPERSRAGVQGVTFRSASATAYVLPVGEEGTTTFVEDASTSTGVVIDGPVDRTTINLITSRLVLR
jgi:hypothetical protein